MSRPYTDDDRLEILKYIIDNKQYYTLHGNEMWKRMERDIDINRSWQSIKEHFRKIMIEQILDYERLGFERRPLNYIKLAYWQTKRNKPENWAENLGLTVDLMEIHRETQAEKDRKRKEKAKGSRRLYCPDDSD